MASFKWANAALASEAENFILPEKIRPEFSDVSQLSSMPIIDMSENQAGLVQKVSQACEEFGFFQIINHGVSPELCRRMLDVTTEFFVESSEEKFAYFSEDPLVKVRVFSRYLKLEEQGKRVSMWSEALFHPWHPTQSFIDPLPKNPPQYR